jgi:hypothetical protein
MLGDIKSLWPLPFTVFSAPQVWWKQFSIASYVAFVLTLHGDMHTLSFIFLSRINSVEDIGMFLPDNNAYLAYDC